MPKGIDWVTVNTKHLQRVEDNKKKGDEKFRNIHIVIRVQLHILRKIQ
jgi:hypothetical protein